MKNNYINIQLQQINLIAICDVIIALINFFVPIVSKDRLFQFIGYQAFLVPIGILVIVDKLMFQKNLS